MVNTQSTGRCLAYSYVQELSGTVRRSTGNVVLPIGGVTELFQTLVV